MDTTLKGYDYTSPGAYLVTIRTNNGVCLFGKIINSNMILNEIGDFVSVSWGQILNHFSNVKLDKFVVMPNHLHGIIIIEENIHAGTACRAPTKEKFGSPVPGSLPTIVRSFKSALTKRINQLCGKSVNHIWQRGYHEHVIRNIDDLNSVREYIINNPLRWDIDKENPMR